MAHESFMILKQIDAYKETLKSAKYWLEQARIRRNGHTKTAPRAKSYNQCLQWAINDTKWLLNTACKMS